MSAYEDLKPQHRTFVEALLADPDQNATRAYHTAYPAVRRAASARAAASRLLTMVNIQTALAERRAQLAAAADPTGERITPERVIAELALIGFADMHAYAIWGPSGVTLRDSTQLDATARRVVSEVSETRTKEGGTIRFKLHNKVEALEKLGTHLGLWQTPAVTETLEWLQTVNEGRDRLQAQLLALAQKATNGHHHD